jgi:iron complex outermembrane recepter protein
VYNTADARIWGGEAEASYAITPRFIVSANAGYIDADYTVIFYDISGDGVIDPADKALALPRVPEWTYGFGLTYDVPLGGVSSLVSSVRFQHRDLYAYTDNNFGRVGESDWLDADITWNLPVKGWSLSVYGRNLLDEVQFGGDTQIPFGGPLSDGNNRPFDPAPAAGTFSPLVKGRTLGVEVAAEF